MDHTGRKLCPPRGLYSFITTCPSPLQGIYSWQAVQFQSQSVIICFFIICCRTAPLWQTHWGPTVVNLNSLFFMRIIHGGIIGNIQTIPFRKFQFPLALMITYSAIAKTILARSRIFHIFKCVRGNQPLKKRLKQKRRIIFKNLQNIFSFAKLLEYFLFLKNT